MARDGRRRSPWLSFEQNGRRGRRIGDTARMTDGTHVVYQGEPGAFSEEAVIGFFGDDGQRGAVPTWRAVFQAVADRSARAGVIAIQSSLAGTIRGTYDLLPQYHERGVRIVGA